MKKIKLLIIAAAALISGSAMAQKIACPDVTLEKGKANLVFSIAENTDETATLAQFVLTMPDGITVETNSKGRFIYEKGELMQDEHTITFQSRKSGGILFLTKNEFGDAFTALNGELVTVPIVAGEDLADGTYSIQVTEVNITNLAAQKIAKETAFTINVTKGSTGIKDVEAEGGVKANGKYLKDGKIVIKKGDKEFNALGGRTK